MSVNKTILIGRIGNEPKLEHTAGGTPVCNISLATERRADKQGEVATDWHRLKAFGKTAELVSKYLSKGREAYFEGSIQYTTSERDGKKSYFTDIIVSEVKFLSNGNQGQRSQSRDTERTEAPKGPPDDSDDLSF
jgi:single-strand DNA-binding protein